MRSATDRLISLLARGHFRAELDPGRLTTPAQYDAVYNVVVLVCALRRLGKPSPDGAIRLNATILKFAHFLAVRPALLGDFREWHERQRQGGGLDLEMWPLLPRGFLLDDAPVAIATYLTALGMLRREGKDIVLVPSEDNPLIQLGERVEAEGWFASERAVLDTLAEVRVTQRLLGIA